MTKTHKHVFLALLVIILAFYAASWLWQRYTFSDVRVDSQDYKALSPWIDRLQDSLKHIDPSLLAYVREKQDLNTAKAFELRYYSRDRQNFIPANH